VKLEQEQQFLIAKKLQELSGSKNIKLKPTIDASVIAGFIVEYGSQQIDMSVRGQVDNVTEVGHDGAGTKYLCVPYVAVVVHAY
jgi:F-type H+-transporting ATPase subunit delta